VSASELLLGSAAGIAAAVRERRSSAGAVVEASLARIAATDAAVNAFTDRTAERARAWLRTRIPGAVRAEGPSCRGGC